MRYLFLKAGGLTGLVPSEIKVALTIFETTLIISDILSLSLKSYKKESESMIRPAFFTNYDYNNYDL